MISNKYKEFYLDTTSGQLKKLSDLLLSWEKNPDDKYLLESILKQTHSMKGAASTMGYQKTAQLLHSLEDIFYALLQQILPIGDQVTEIIFKTSTILEDNLHGIIKTGQEKNLTKDINKLDKLLKSKSKSINRKAKAETAAPKTISHSKHSSFTPLEVVVPTIRLDKIQSITDNLAVNKMLMRSAGATHDDDQFLSACIESDKLVADLRREIASLRMLSVSQVFTPLPRLVRELAHAENKKIDFIIEDNDLSLDKSVLDDLMDIVVQLLRNAVVHGIGSKQKNGQIILQTELANDQVNVIVADNGQGIDWQKVLEIALRKKIVTLEESKKMTISDIKNLVFNVGFSSRQKINLRSGRGIGLSLVKEKVDALKGELFLESSKQRGTRFVIRFPMPTSIFHSLIFQLSKFSLAIPLSYVEKVIKLPQPISFDKQKTFMHHKVKYQLLSLAKILGLPRLPVVTQNLIVLKGKAKHALPMPQVVREEEVIIKRTPKVLQNHKLISSVAVAADGQPILILDMPNLIN